MNVLHHYQNPFFVPYALWNSAAKRLQTDIIVNRPRVFSFVVAAGRNAETTMN